MMKMMTVAMSLAALVACTDKATCDSGEVCDSDSVSGDSGTTYETAFDTIEYNCDSVGWFYDLYSIGWMGGAELYIYQTGSSDPWDEFHNFPSESYDYDPGGAWDNYYMELDHVESYTDVVEGSTTLYDCDDGRKATLTWAVIVYDQEGAQADCATWGDDPGFGAGAGCTEV